MTNLIYSRFEKNNLILRTSLQLIGPSWQMKEHSLRIFVLESLIDSWSHDYAFLSRRLVFSNRVNMSSNRNYHWNHWRGQIPQHEQIHFPCSKSFGAGEKIEIEVTE